MELKHIGPFVIKDEVRGEVEAEIATIGVVDRDGDVFLAGSTPANARVKVSHYGHDVVLDLAPPAGVGTVIERGDKIVLNARFFMTTERGRESFATVKELGPDGEWSIGFPDRSVVEGELTEEWAQKGARRVIAHYEPMEASPVFRGAQPGTRTLAVKREAADAAEQAEVRAIEEAVIARDVQIRLDQAEARLAALDRELFRPPSLEHKQVADFTAEIAAKLLHCRDNVPRVAWTVVAKGDPTTGFIRWDSPDRIYIARDLALGEVCKTVLHECKHILTQNPWDRSSVSERFATEFERGWAYAVWSAGTAVKWRSERVHVVDRDTPRSLFRPDRDRMVIKRGDIVLCRGTATAWRWSGESWSRA